MGIWEILEAEWGRRVRGCSYNIKSTIESKFPHATTAHIHKWRSHNKEKNYYLINHTHGNISSRFINCVSLFWGKQSYYTDNCRKYSGKHCGQHAMLWEWMIMLLLCLVSCILSPIWATLFLLSKNV